MMSTKRKASQKPVEILNGGFGKYIDEDSGYDYYYNSATDESTYDRPAGFATEKGDIFASVRTKGDQSAAMLSAKRGKKEKPAEELNGNWARFSDPESGYDYYYNSATDASTYDRPDVFATVKGDIFASGRGSASNLSANMLSSRRSKKQKPEEVLNGGWERFSDPEVRMVGFSFFLFV